MDSPSEEHGRRCEVKGCRRPLFLAGVCGYHALQAESPTVNKSRSVKWARESQDRRAPHAADPAIA
jgi:hypothetical protein